MAALSLEHGNSDGSCLAYVWLGGILGTYFGDYQTGFRFGRLGLDLVEKRGLTVLAPASTWSSPSTSRTGRSTCRPAAFSCGALSTRRSTPETLLMQPIAAPT